MNKTEVIKKLEGYNENDIVFLKSRWNKLIKQGRLDVIKDEKGINPQIVYSILEISKIKNIKLAKYEVDRYNQT